MTIYADGAGVHVSLLFFPPECGYADRSAGRSVRPSQTRDEGQKEKQMTTLPASAAAPSTSTTFYLNFFKASPPMIPPSFFF